MRLQMRENRRIFLHEHERERERPLGSGPPPQSYCSIRLPFPPAPGPALAPTQGEPVSRSVVRAENGNLKSRN